MGDSGILIGWDRVVPGEDVGAVELWRELTLYLARVRAEGLIESHEAVMLGAHGGDLNGFILIRGSQDGLHKVRNSDEFLQLVVKANKKLLGLRVLRAHFGAEVQKLMRIYATL